MLVSHTGLHRPSCELLVLGWGHMWNGIRFVMWGGCMGMNSCPHVTVKCLYLCLSMSVCLSACLSLCLYVCLSVCMSVCLRVCLSVYMSVSLFVCVSLCMYVCMSVLSVCRWGSSAEWKQQWLRLVLTWRHGFKRWEGKDVAISGQTAANVRQRRYRCLEFQPCP